ncbi:MAG: hypothetical protein ACI4OT_03035 [Bacilli bacterium]
MDLMSFEQFKQTPEYQKFIEENPSFGTLKVEAFTAFQGMPIENTEILITKDIGDHKVLFFKGYTDSSGIIDNIILPAPKEEPVASYEKRPEYTVYDLTAIHDQYEIIKKYNIGMFGGIKVIQYVKMIPDIEVEENTNGN